MGFVFAAAGWLPPALDGLACALSAFHLLLICFPSVQGETAHRPQTRPGGRPLPAVCPPHRHPYIHTYICSTHWLPASARAPKRSARASNPKRHQKRGRPPRAVAASSSSARRASLSTRPPSTRRGSPSTPLPLNEEGFWFGAAGLCHPDEQASVFWTTFQLSRALRRGTIPKSNG